jgi:hypothetical protein
MRARRRALYSTAVIQHDSDAGVLSRDTTRQAERIQVRAWRSMSSIDLARLVAGATRAVRTLAFSGLRERYPTASEQQLVALYAELTLGRDLARRVYPELERLDG